MALYIDLRDLANDSDLQARTQVAVVVAAETIYNDGSPPANQVQRLEWAKGALESPLATAKSMLNAVLAVSKDATIAQIQAADDATLQGQVDALIDLFAGT